MVFYYKIIPSMVHILGMRRSFAIYFISFDVSKDQTKHTLKVVLDGAPASPFGAKPYLRRCPCFCRQLQNQQRVFARKVFKPVHLWMLSLELDFYGIIGNQNIH